MINRDNWKDVQEYMENYRKSGKDEKSVLLVKSFLRHLLEWADEKPLGNARLIDPAFQVYLLTARNDGKERPLSAASMAKICQAAQRFFAAMRGDHPARYKNVPLSWIETIRPPVSHGTQSEYHEHEFYSLEMMLRIARLRPGSLRLERDQAGMCFMFLSAMRVQAFLSLPMRCVDLEHLSVLQLPEMGVLTKNRKAAKTHLLRIPELLEVVRGWEAKLKGLKLGRDDLWYAVMDGRSTQLGGRRELSWHSRAYHFSQGIRELCELAEIPYLSSHKLRHGHIYFMMKKVKDMKDLKSVSQNVMHSSVQITDQVYGRMVAGDIERVYEEFGGE